MVFDTNLALKYTWKRGNQQDIKCNLSIGGWGLGAGAAAMIEIKKEKGKP